MEENKNNELETNEKIVDKNKFIFSKDLLKKLNTTKAMIVALVLVFIAAGYYFKSSFVVASVNGNFISKASFVEELEKQSGKQVLEKKMENNNE